MALNLKLPTEYNVPSTKLFDYNWLFSGGKGTGKTSFSIALAGPKHIVIQGEPGNCKHLFGCRFVDIHSWEELEGYINLIRKTPGYCENIVLDDLPSIYSLAVKHVRKVKGWDSSPEKKFSYAEWGWVRNLFTDFMIDFKSLPYGKICTTHLKSEEHETGGGQPTQRLEPNISGQLFSIVEGNFPFHLQGVLYKERDSSRQLYINNDDIVLATNKFPNRFLWNDKPLIKISMGGSPEEGKENFIKAFNNEYQGKVADKKLNSQANFTPVKTEAKKVPAFVFNSKKG